MCCVIYLRQEFIPPSAGSIGDWPGFLHFSLGINCLRASSSKVTSLFRGSMCPVSICMGCGWGVGSWWAYAGPAPWLKCRATLGTIPTPERSVGAAVSFCGDCILLSPTSPSFTSYTEISVSDSVFQETQSLTIPVLLSTDDAETLAHP